MELAKNVNGTELELGDLDGLELALDELEELEVLKELDTLEALDKL